MYNLLNFGGEGNKMNRDFRRGGGFTYWEGIYGGNVVEGSWKSPVVSYELT